MEDLRQYWNPLTERCGYIDDQQRVVALPNLSSDPTNDFHMVIPEGVNITHLWHTHPKTSANLSVADYHAFLAKPEFRHLIISESEIREYYISGGVVYQSE